MCFEQMLSPVGAAVFTDGQFGKTPLSQGYIQFECSDQFSEDQWTECTVSAPSCTNCNGDAIKCFSKSNCCIVVHSFARDS